MLQLNLNSFFPWMSIDKAFWNGINRQKIDIVQECSREKSYGSSLGYEKIRFPAYDDSSGKYALHYGQGLPPLTLQQDCCILSMTRKTMKDLAICYT